jgi:uncharacterized protein DUF3108
MKPIVAVVAPLMSLVAATTMVAQRASRPTPPAAPAAKSAPTRVERPVPFAVGETLNYDVSWSSYLTAGSVSVAVREKRPSFNSTAYYIVAEARPTPLLSKLYSLYYKLDTLLDSYTLLPQRGSVYSEEGRRHRFKTTQFDRRAGKVLFEYKADTTVKADFPTSPVTQDALSAIYVLRAIPLQAGDRMTMPVTDNGINYKVRFDVAGQERVRTPLGDQPAWKVKLSVFDDKSAPVGPNVAIWMGDAPRRLPVKLQADLAVGSFNLTLRDAR